MIKRSRAQTPFGARLGPSAEAVTELAPRTNCQLYIGTVSNSIYQLRLRAGEVKYLVSSEKKFPYQSR